WIIELDDMGMPPSKHFVRELMLEIMWDRGDRADTPSEKLGKDVINWFHKRYPTITSRFFQAIN
ncbi:hypothetical protein C7212DRAFT_222557, partial [Tuber magnatum]